MNTFRIAAGLLLALTLAAVWAATPSPVARAALPHICLDAGHGGSAEPGAVKVFSDGSILREAEINLDIALYLQAEWQGVYNVTMTRDSDVRMSTRERYEKCNASGADILVSVHTNSVADTSVDGMLAVYFHNDDKVLAQSLYDAMLALKDSAPDPNNFTLYGLKHDALGIVLKSNMPAAVVEPVMMSNDAEAPLLVDDIATCSDPADNTCRRAQIADAIMQGVDSYFAGSPPPPSDGGGGGPPPCKGPNKNDPGC